jgi:crotonobetainyl-CoA:carnitine CoA-transferase CaiB-like acyl-CoA transferase
VDLKNESGRARALALAAQADVFCEGFRPGVADRLGLGEGAIRAANPSVVYCSISGFGQTGPLRDAPGHDLTYQAAGGAVGRAGPPGTPPALPALPVADLAAGVYAAALVCAAWAKKLSSGEGERIDVAMADVVASWIGPAASVEVAGADRATTGSPGYGIFEAADGKLLTLAALSEQHLWDAICEGLGLPERRGIPFAERLRRCDELNEEIRAAVARMPGDEAVARLTSSGAPVMAVLTPAEMAAHPQFRARGMFLDGGEGEVMALPAILTAHPRRTEVGVPELGEHPEGFSPAS